MKINSEYKIFNGITLFLDFDGILSGSMFYDEKQKSHKSAQYGARHVIEIFHALGAKIHIVTGDSSDNGLRITDNIINRLRYSTFNKISNDEKLSFILNHKDFDFHKSFYIADDLYDIVTAKFVKTIVPNNAHSFLKQNAVYSSNNSANDYLMIDVLSYILSFVIERHNDAKISNELFDAETVRIDMRYLEILLSIIMFSNQKVNYKTLDLTAFAKIEKNTFLNLISKSKMHHICIDNFYAK